MVAERNVKNHDTGHCCSLAKISMVAELYPTYKLNFVGCSLAKISMVAELQVGFAILLTCCSLAKISMVAEQ